MAEPEKFAQIEEIAEHLQLSISTVRSWVRQGIIPKDTYIKIGSTYRFNIPKVLDALIAYDEQKVQVDSSSQRDPNQLELDFSNPDQNI